MSVLLFPINPHLYINSLATSACLPAAKTSSPTRNALPFNAFWSMINHTLPYYLEDRTGVFSGSDFDDMYDRAFLRISSPPSHLSYVMASTSPSPPSTPSPFSLIVYAATRRSSLNKAGYGDRAAGMRPGEPAILLQFGPRGALGSVTFLGPPSERGPKEKGLGIVAKETIQMGQWLRKTSLFGGSLLRKFKASNGEEYRWLHQGVEGQEWSLLDSRDQLVAHYNLRPPSKPAYTTSGNILTIHETHAHLAVEILASLTIMRHIAAHNL